jgi:hypothetical protein
MPDETEFEPFDLSVLYAGDAAGIWLSASSRLGAVNAVPRQDRSLYQLTELLNDADWFRSAIREGKAVVDQGARFGGQLRDLVFGVPEISLLFRRTRGAAYGASRPLLLRLLAAPEEVAALPWELLRDPDDPSTPLIFTPDAHLTRAARDRRYPLRLNPVTPPLHVLLILSNPNASGDGEDDAPFDHYEEGRSLVSELQDLIDRGAMVVDVENRPSIENLRRRIGARERGYHVIHYLGHARPDGLKLESRNGQPSWVPTDKFNALLRTNPDLRLVFFAGCRTASLAPHARDGEFASQLSIADRCVRDACQTVLGMQAVLPFRVEQVLTRSFYQALCAGATVARAISLARAATRDDEELGRDLLNWAVPSLVTGHQPGRIVALPQDAAQPQPRRPRRAQLKLDLTEPDREFFARFGQLRETLNVLCRRGGNRVVWITGAPGSGKSRLLARALDELDDSIVAVLYVRSLRLANGDGPATELCLLVNELLEKAERPGVKRQPVWSPEEWWDRLIEELVDVPIVLAVDDVDQLDQEGAAELGAVLDRLVARVSKVRVALAGGDGMREGFLGADTWNLVSPVHVLTLGPTDVMQWVRRNRPALATALAALGQSELGAIHNELGFKLHLWARLAEEYDRQPIKDMHGAVQMVMNIEGAASPAQLTAAGAPGPTPAPVAGRGPIRVAIAGPYTVGRQKQFADAMAALALKYGAGARVVPEGAPDAGTALAHLLPLESPFAPPDFVVQQDDIIAWLNGLVQQRPDIVLLDYGSATPNIGQEQALRTLADEGALLLAPAGDDHIPSYPAWHDFVLAVGGLDERGSIAPYSRFFPEAGKPDLFAIGTVAGTSLKDVPNLPPGAVEGTSLAALNALMVATCMWALDRTMTAQQVERTLKQTASKIGRRVGPKRLDIDSALGAARGRLVLRALLTGPLDEQGVATASGLSVENVRPLLEMIVRQNLAKREADQYLGHSESLRAALA